MNPTEAYPSADATDATWIKMPGGFWYVACASVILRAQPIAAKVLDKDLVLFRDSEGVPHALLDRCCHRGVQLSLGSVVAGRLKCRYHGWEYDGSGQCVHIPSLRADQSIHKGQEVPAFACVEQDGYVWVWPSPDEPTPAPTPVPTFEAHRWSQGSIPMRCASIAGLENNLDWCHASFTHPWTHPQYFKTKIKGLQEESFEMRVTDRGLVIFAPITSTAESPVPMNATRIYFELPDRIVFAIAGAEATIVLHFVPTGPATCRMEWLARRPAAFGRRVQWSSRAPRIFREDRAVLESAQEWYDRAGSTFERSVEADAPGLLLRRIIALAAQGKWPAGRQKLPERRILTVRA